jgi:hypothetical protein
VGINTTALVDSAIVRRPVFTIVNDQFRSTQTGTLHFSYLAREGCGLLHVAHSWPEHFEQLGAAMRSPDGHREQLDQFLRAFIRPQGLDVPAAPQAVRAVEQAASHDKQPASARGPLRWLVGVWARALGSVHLVFEWLKPSARARQLSKTQRRMAKRIRKRAKKRRVSGDGPRPTAVGSQAQAPKPKDRGAKSADRAVREREKAAARAAKEERRAAKSSHG